MTSGEGDCLIFLAFFPDLALVDGAEGRDSTILNLQWAMVALKWPPL